METRVTVAQAVRALVQGACHVPRVGTPLAKLSTADLIWAEDHGIKAADGEPPMWTRSHGSGNGSGDGYGYGDGYGSSYGDGDGDGLGYGYGSSYGDGDGSGSGYGSSYGDGDGDGSGFGDGSGNGYGYGDLGQQVRAITDCRKVKREK